MKIKGIKIGKILEIASIEGNGADVVQIMKALVVLIIFLYAVTNKEKIKGVSEKMINKITKENTIMKSNVIQEN